MQLTYHADAHKSTCTPAPIPTFRVVEPPKNGVLTVRKGVLTTNKVAGCPGLKTPVLAVFYQSKEGYSGSDHVSYAVTNAAGQTQGYDVTITVKAAPAGSAPPSPTPPTGKLAVRQAQRDFPLSLRSSSGFVEPLGSVRHNN